MGQIGYARRTAPVVAILVLSLGLSGCIAAAGALMPLVGVGMGALTIFQTYKTVQLAGGGSVEIAFPGKDGKTAPVQPLAPVHRVAVWPGDEGDVHFAERLQGSGKFASVVAPASSARILTEAREPVDLKQMTQQEQGVALDALCRRAHVDLVFGSIALGASENDNSFSFSSANVTYTSDLIGYSCAEHTIVWRDHIALIIHVGGSVSSTSEMNRAGADAWAERVFAAMGSAPVSHAT